MSQDNRNFAIVWVYCGQSKEIFVHPSVKICQLKRNELISQPQYKNGKLQIRRQGAIKFKKEI